MADKVRVKTIKDVVNEINREAIEEERVMTDPNFNTSKKKLNKRSQATNEDIGKGLS